MFDLSQIPPVGLALTLIIGGGWCWVLWAGARNSRRPPEPPAREDASADD